ncbi:hypothetical protein PRIPAC_81977 [Pristionchus pacificus]|uniref:Uncharacterized protein n=1 Tax=Pristionchus pacificus TaxID=54126 RepID=A0A2A6BX58_PRIPA|nr:hypothetical protein PRIPAC_81977 [Pristionchus pacificus]|eukprot:PDM70437.1 hypothetical protein PRIPAC_46683 [Pristionchus pacificus]
MPLTRLVRALETTDDGVQPVLLIRSGRTTFLALLLLIAGIDVKSYEALFLEKNITCVPSINAATPMSRRRGSCEHTENGQPLTECLPNELFCSIVSYAPEKVPELRLVPKAESVMLVLADIVRAQAMDEGVP